jgi:hypothetical protein
VVNKTCTINNLHNSCRNPLLGVPQTVIFDFKGSLGAGKCPTTIWREIMRGQNWTALPVGVAMLASTGLSTQQPGAILEKLPFNTPYGACDKAC